MKDNTWIWSSGFDEKLIKKVEEISEEKGLVLGEILNYGVNQNDSTKRISNICFIEDAEIREAIWGYVTDANCHCFGFDIVNIFDVQFGEYRAEDKGCYGWHCDSWFVTDKFVDRKLSIVIQLSDPSEYEGGELEFDIEGKTFKPINFNKKGSVIVFPSFIRHRVTPITKGIRHSLVAWIQGPIFK